MPLHSLFQCTHPVLLLTFKVLLTQFIQHLTPTHLSIPSHIVWTTYSTMCLSSILSIYPNNLRSHWSTLPVSLQFPIHMAFLHFQIYSTTSSSMQYASSTSQILNFLFYTCQVLYFHSIQSNWYNFPLIYFPFNLHTQISILPHISWYTCCLSKHPSTWNFRALPFLSLYWYENLDTVLKPSSLDLIQQLIIWFCLNFLSPYIW